MSMNIWNKGSLLALLLAVITLSGCDRLRVNQPDFTLPDKEEAAAFYESYQGLTSVELSGNVVVLNVQQPKSQLQRGGSLWAQVGPYIYLLSPATRNLLAAYPGVAAVRVITFTGQEEVARAMLLRDAMGEYQWQRSIELLGLALKEGTAMPGRMADLVRWGEQFAEYEYSPTYGPKQR